MACQSDIKQQWRRCGRIDYRVPICWKWSIYFIVIELSRKHRQTFASYYRASADSLLCREHYIYNYHARSLILLNIFIVAVPYLI
jgi:hypothetical protein